jgi:hypothetical protein
MESLHMVCRRRRIHSSPDVLTADRAAQIFIWAYFYDMTVTHFGDRAAIAAVPWTFNAAFVMHTTISAIVQVRASVSSLPRS